MNNQDFLDVTEVAGEPISAEQLDRLNHRYSWASQFCRGRDVVECACGTGPGLGVLAAVARSIEAGDLSDAMVARARGHYGARVGIGRFDAQEMPFASGSKDVVVLFEALYYLPDADRFVAECRRVLRPGGRVLIATANKDLPDFNPSPYSHRYYGAVELGKLFADAGMTNEIYGYMPIDTVSLRQRVLRPVKRAVAGLGLMPKSMKRKQLLKRLVFGRPVTMPTELVQTDRPFEPPVPFDRKAADIRHKVLYAVGVVPDSV